MSPDPPHVDPSGSAAADRAPPTVAPPPPRGLASVLERNIHALSERRQREARGATIQQKAAAAITRFTGSMAFVYLHLLLFGGWIGANIGWVPGIVPWDPSFGILAMWASVEAIFLSTFVLISQNRMQAVADERADLDLQISLLAEHEVTKIAKLLSSLADRMGLDATSDPELAEIQKNVAPEAVLDEIEEAQPR